MNYRDIIAILQKHRDDIKAKIDEGENGEYFTGAYDEVSLTIEALETVVIQDAESMMRMKKFMEQINELQKRKVK